MIPWAPYLLIVAPLAVGGLFFIGLIVLAFMAALPRGEN